MSTHDDSGSKRISEGSVKDPTSLRSNDEIVFADDKTVFLYEKDELQAKEDREQRIVFPADEVEELETNEVFGISSNKGSTSNRNFEDYMRDPARFRKEDSDKELDEKIVYPDGKTVFQFKEEELKAKEGREQRIVFPTDKEYQGDNEEIKSNDISEEEMRNNKDESG